MRQRQQPTVVGCSSWLGASGARLHCSVQTCSNQCRSFPLRQARQSWVGERASGVSPAAQRQSQLVSAICRWSWGAGGMPSWSACCARKPSRLPYCPFHPLTQCIASFGHTLYIRAPCSLARCPIIYFRHTNSPPAAHWAFPVAHGACIDVSATNEHPAAHGVGMACSAAWLRPGRRTGTLPAAAGM